jgi:hypothetical protein
VKSREIVLFIHITDEKMASQTIGSFWSAEAQTDKTEFQKQRKVGKNRLDKHGGSRDYYR